LNEIVTTQAWSDRPAVAIYYGLEKMLKNGVKIGKAMQEASNKAVAEVEELMRMAGAFAKKHRVYCTLVVLGVLAVLLPWAIEALGFELLGSLGFEEVGPVAGNLASHIPDVFRMSSGRLPAR